jgi:carbon monoxide dehydrogenase subunit G
MEHEHTEHVAAAPERVYAAIANVENLPQFMPQVTAARREGDRVRIEARYEGHSREGEAWFRADDDQRRIEWGVDGGGYHGWLQVNADGDASRLTLSLTTARGDAPDHEVMGTLDAIRRLLEREV